MAVPIRVSASPSPNDTEKTAIAAEVKRTLHISEEAVSDLYDTASFLQDEIDLFISQ